MKRAFVVTLASALAGLTFACSAQTETLKGGDPQGSIGGNASDDSTPAASTPAASTTQKTTTTSTATDAGASSDGGNPLAACDPAQTTTFEACAECCATKQPAVADLDTCACGTNSKCGASCGRNLCTGDVPSIDCALCLVQSGCDFGNADPGTNTDDGEACLTQCASKQ